MFLFEALRKAKTASRDREIFTSGKILVMTRLSRRHVSLASETVEAGSRNFLSVGEENICDDTKKTVTRTSVVMT